MEPPQVSLKVIVVTQFVLTIWASMPPFFLPVSYTYMNAFVLVFGVWALVNRESTEAVLMFLILELFTILQDCIFLGIYQPRAYDALEMKTHSDHGSVHEYRFALGMAIINLILKPLICFLLYRIYQDRGGSYGMFTIPGLSTRPGGAYENIDQPIPSNNVEPASPHQYIEKPPLEPCRSTRVKNTHATHIDYAKLQPVETDGTISLDLKPPP